MIVFGWTFCTCAFPVTDFKEKVKTSTSTQLNDLGGNVLFYLELTHKKLHKVKAQY